jgi:Mycoplasma protein of unknown function, DUF285
MPPAPPTIMIVPQACLASRSELQNAVQSYLMDPSGFPYSSRAQLYGYPIGDWCLGGNVTDLSFLFAGATAFNEPLDWNVSNVRTFSNMFAGASSFQQNLCKWGPLLAQENATIAFDSMFNGTSCTNTSDPNLLATPPGPFCEPCT